MSETTILEILHSIQKNLKAPKSQLNKFGNYKYRNCEDILEAVKSVMPPGVVVLLNDEIIMAGDRFYVKARASISYGEKTISVDAYAREPLVKKGMDESQITGAASSYARKYALNALFLIDDTKDADSNREEDKQQPANDVSSNPYAPIVSEIVGRLRSVLVHQKVPKDKIDSWLKKAGVSTVNELPNDKAQAIIEMLSKKGAQNV